jgi:hypothetical protein
MKRIYSTIILLAAGSLAAAAQRLDGCPVHQTPFSVAQTASGEAVDRGLQDSGVSPTRESLAIALSDSRPEVRSLAALKLGKIGQRADVAPLLRAWAAEEDTCTAGIVRQGLERLLQRFAFDPGRRPDFVAPFQPCTAPEPLLVSLNLEQVKARFYDGPALRVTARNQTAQTLPFLSSRSPAELFSVTVLDPTGAPAKVAERYEWMYEPVRGFAVISGHMPTFLPLPPQEDVSWTWRVGEEFDMSAPGTYRVSFGGRVPYLDTTVCSNTAEISVEKQP